MQPVGAEGKAIEMKMASIVAENNLKAAERES